ncbi:phasin family protein [Ramlibacter rhizophilus]|nr:phasin family protein [Ramlibacter rhizophilus]
MNPDPDRPDPQSPDNESGPESPRQSARRIWLAGLGALSRAQAEGGKLFDTLVQEGQTLQRRTNERVSQASARVSEAAADLSGRATGGLGRLESLIEERLAKRLARLGLPDREEFEALRRRVETLENEVDELLDTLERYEGDSAPAARRRAAGSRRADPDAPVSPEA